MAGNPDENRFDEGISLIKAGRFEEAIDIFSELVERDERNHKAWNAYGVALSQTVHKESAIHCFENALHLDPENKVYRRNLSRVKTPPTKRGPPKMTELGDEKRGKNTVIIGAAVIIALFLIIGITGLYVTGIIPGFSQIQEEPVIEEIPVIIEPTVTILPQNTTNESEPVIIPSPVETPIPPPPPPKTLVHFIDVSQGDAALVQSQGKNLLIDAGPSVSSQRLVSYLKERNVSTLDLVVASHPSEDHIGGMIDVLETFQVKTYVDNGYVDSSDLYHDVIGSVISDQAVRLIAVPGTAIPFTEDVKIDVIGPYRLTGHLEEDSLALLLSIGNVSVIFPGDAPDVKGKATILKLPDHGSDDAVSSIMNTRPEAAIISVASGNPFDYPRSATLAALEKEGSQVYRTDVNGSIVITTDGENWSVTTDR